MGFKMKLPEKKGVGKGAVQNDIKKKWRKKKSTIWIIDSYHQVSGNRPCFFVQLLFVVGLMSFFFI